ncbi:MAG: FecR domain-containing protein, partial [Limisphaerales bacterium]
NESTVDLFINNSVIRITPDTTFGLTKALVTETGADTVTDTELYLKSGRILGNVKKLAAASKYQIKTPNGVTGIRGTEFDISYINNRLTITSLNGTLVGSAANARGEIKTGVVNTGESWSPDDGIAPIPQQDLANFRGQVPPFVDPIVVTPPAAAPNPVIIYVEPGIGATVSPASPNQ